MLRRWLDVPPQLTDIISKDLSLPAQWSKNQVIPLPKDRKYQHCLFKCQGKQDAQLLELDECEGMPEKSLILQLIIMGDPFWFTLFKADFGDRNNIKGDLRVKVHISDVQDVSFDKSEFKKLNMVLNVKGQTVRPSLIFDNPQKAQESRDYILFNKSQLPNR